MTGSGVSARTPRTAHRRSARWLLVPKEHGAYAQLVFPLITGLALGRPSGAQICWIAAALALFIAHEPLLILAGERGRRLVAELGPRARSLAGFLVTLALGAGALGWWLAPYTARLGILVPVIFGTMLVALIVTHREKTLSGELLASATFASMAIPVGLAGEASIETALAAGTVWCAVFVLLTLTVRVTIGRVKKTAGSSGAWLVNLALCAAVMTAALFLSRSGAIPLLVAVAVAPAVMIASVFSVVELHPRRLRTLGWSMAATNVLTLMALLAGLR